MKSLKVGNISRRNLIKAGLMGSVAAAFGFFSDRVALAAGLPKLATTDPTAVALNYVENQAEAKKKPQFKAGSSCANCNFYLQANSGCQLFPGKSVAPTGWCASWFKKAA